MYSVFSASATNKAFLRLMGFTHVLNTAEGSRFGQVDTGHSYYRDMPEIRYMGFPMTDQPSTDISRYFYIAAKFIENGVNSGGGKFWNSNIPQSVYFISFAFLECYRQGPSPLYDGHLTVEHVRPCLPDDRQEDVGSRCHSNGANASRYSAERWIPQSAGDLGQ